MTDLLYSEEEEALRAAVRDLLADHCDAPGVIARTESDAPHDLAAWKALADGMGLAGLLVPEAQGGQGAGHREVAVVMEELGRAVAPVPYLSSAVVATEALLECGDEELLGQLASGRAVGVLAVGLHRAPGTAFPAVRLENGVLHGELTAIADAVAADVLLVPAEDGGLYAVDASDATVTPQSSLDLTRPLATVTLNGATARRLGDAEPAVRRALRSGAGLLASEQFGLAEWALTETVRYLKERKQFNRPVGGFQALKHRLAQLWLETVNLRAAARNAADALATGEDVDVAVAVAQSYAAPVAVHAAEEALQLHAGIGMTWEHPIHLYLKRAKADSIAYGTAGAHRSAVAELVGLQAP
ncbi:acyl-CoA/acyl-ACP dehydrogenase [Streptomyces spinosirectus]|jgi:alkylation response protein AidB-like acyl-CoA dehydrogenase|uniref:acyl-CoA dehydrogenase family protein n=1 Tax=Streptomyces TaxID=1883 RepID=UPI000D34D2AC|nr:MULTISPECIES: acyl-CoA dehydrogenase family protein [Streptomyces]PTM96947.1 alkylation response protein AidB-like acyl-CoA dehydrogenase [Streptomyces sp. VMFN-G11Ma]UIR16500.1 acyl-CoA/acyl-ACP dehydrogenase [Streptomyces spinosirectus]